MTRFAPLDNVAHADLRLKPGHGQRFGDCVNQVPVFPSEFAAVQRDCPILFHAGEGGLAAVAILGLERDSNLFVSDGRWDARYVPALTRTGPFRLGGGVDGDLAVLVDLDHPRIADAEDAEALPLFREHGGHAPALESAIAALRTVHAGLAQMAQMAEQFAESGVIEPANLTVTRANGQQVRFDGYLAVAEDRLAALSGEQLERLNAAGLLGPAFQAAASIANFNTLLARDALRAA